MHLPIVKRRLKINVKPAAEGKIPYFQLSFVDVEIHQVILTLGQNREFFSQNQFNADTQIIAFLP